MYDFGRSTLAKILALTALAASALQAGCARGGTEVSASGAPPPASSSDRGTAPKLDVPYEPSAPEAVTTMLRLGRVTADDVVYDLGCGDGRLVIAAVQRHGARGVCVDLDPERIRESRENARRAGVEDRITFLNQDLFATDLDEATVVMLFLWPKVNLQLRPKLLRELPPGARVVSHWHDMGDWKPDETVKLKAEGRERSIHVWTIPEKR